MVGGSEVSEEVGMARYMCHVSCTCYMIKVRKVMNSAYSQDCKYALQVIVTCHEANSNITMTL